LVMQFISGPDLAQNPCAAAGRIPTPRGHRVGRSVAGCAHLFTRARSADHPS
jgi:hypothetical protein